MKKVKTTLKAFRLPALTFARVAKARKKGESFSDFLRAAVERELTKRDK